MESSNWPLLVHLCYFPLLSLWLVETSQTSRSNKKWRRPVFPKVPGMGGGGGSPGGKAAVGRGSLGLLWARGQMTEGLGSQQGVLTSLERGPALSRPAWSLYASWSSALGLVDTDAALPSRLTCVEARRGLEAPRWPESIW